MTSTPHRLAAAALALAAGAAGAVVGPPTVENSAGQMSSITYGAAGTVDALSPFLSVAGLGAVSDPATVTALTPSLSYAFGSSDAGTSLLRVHFVIDNTSTTESFNDLRFAVAIDPNGGAAPDFLDRAGEGWGAKVAGGPDRRQVGQRAAPDPLAAEFGTNRNLLDLPPGGGCASPGGCDVVGGLQWNLGSLGPQQRWTVTVGLSDLPVGEAAASLSGDRRLSFVAVGDEATRLTLSGLAVVSAVPEPATWATFAVGLVLLGWRRLRRTGA